MWLLRSVQEQGCVPPHSVLRSALYLLALTQDKSPSLDGVTLSQNQNTHSNFENFQSSHYLRYSVTVEVKFKLYLDFRLLCYYGALRLQYFELFFSFF